jgi:hypothetical protein
MRYFLPSVLVALFTSTSLSAPTSATPTPDPDAFQKAMQLKALQMRDAEVRSEIERIQVTIGQLQNMVAALKQRFPTADDVGPKEMSLTITDQDHFVLGKRPVDKKTLTEILRQLSAIYPGRGTLTISGYEAHPPQALANILQACFDGHFYNIYFNSTK